MTPSQLSHLHAIDAHLKHLLEDIAAKRTPGEWFSDSAEYSCAVILEHDIGRPITVMNPVAALDKGKEQDATFIASCAGNAEAGWKATRAAIADWLSLYNSTEGYADGATDASPHDKLCNEVASICRINLQHILAAFPLEALNS